MVRRRAATAVDIRRDATEVIALESFRPLMSREIRKGERFARDNDLAKTYPAYFGLLLPLSAIEDEGNG
jgi:hypothetical protein